MISLCALSVLYIQLLTRVTVEEAFAWINKRKLNFGSTGNLNSDKLSPKGDTTAARTSP